jgi:hypothetical protein
MSQQFPGFPRPRANHFPMPDIWIDICAYIDNLAELKVVQYVLRHTWAAYEYDVVRRITVNEFMYGIVDEYTGERIDSGTGLSEQSVRNGLKKALAHGLLVCEEDHADRSDIKKFYRLHLYGEVQTLDLKRLDPQSLDLKNRVQTLDLKRLDPQSLDPTISSYDTGGEVQTLDRTRKENSVTRKKNSSSRIPIWIKSFADDFSRDFHDEAHIGPNIKQMHNLYRQSGLDEETFMAILYEAREITKRAAIRKKTPTGYPNRMPYFFRCLRRLIEEGQQPAMHG